MRKNKFHLLMLRLRKWPVSPGSRIFDLSRSFILPHVSFQDNTKKEGEERIGFGQDWVWMGPIRTLTFQRLIGRKEAGNWPMDIQNTR